jgi:hypothetical protein
LTLIGSHFTPQIEYDRFNQSLPDFPGVPASLRRAENREWRETDTRSQFVPWSNI